MCIVPAFVNRGNSGGSWHYMRCSTGTARTDSAGCPSAGRRDGQCRLPQCGPCRAEVRGAAGRYGCYGVIRAGRRRHCRIARTAQWRPARALAAGGPTVSRRPADAACRSCITAAAVNAAGAATACCVISQWHAVCATARAVRGSPTASSGRGHRRAAAHPITL